MSVRTRLLPARSVSSRTLDSWATCASGSVKTNGGRVGSCCCARRTTARSRICVSQSRTVGVSSPDTNTSLPTSDPVRHSPACQAPMWARCDAARDACGSRGTPHDDRHRRHGVVTARTGRPSTTWRSLPCVSVRQRPSQATALGAGSCRPRACGIRRRGFASVQVWRVGGVSRLHQTSSCNPKTHSGGRTARALTRSRPWCCARRAVQGACSSVWPASTGAPPVGGPGGWLPHGAAAPSRPARRTRPPPGQCPPPWGLARETRRLRHEMLQAVTVRGSQPGRDGLGTVRLLRQALHAPRVQDRDDVTDGLDGIPPLGHGLRGLPPGTGADDWGPPATAGVRGVAVGLPLPTRSLGQGAHQRSIIGNGFPYARKMRQELWHSL